MADDPVTGASPGIAALPPTTVRQIGSQQVIVDPSSVVKELVDNALDARAKSIFVDITANTLDLIQVKDDGHGIPAQDRPLACRRYCTSKIRDFHDLKDVGGKWLGFRGEALASMAGISGALSVTTRVEGEPVAVKLVYGRDGELTTDSHPVGTTVKVTNIFKPIPVRIQASIKNSAKCLAKIRRLMQAYALARPAVRFRLHVLKAKNNKGDFIYAPKTSANVEDAVLKIIGKDCALQCDWTALETDGLEIHAFLPKPTANGSKISNYGGFISVDSRPMSNVRGFPKRIVNAFRGRLRKANTSLREVRDPFFCINIICPPDSYDPNLEPAKDNVVFDDEDLVVSAVDKLLTSYYPEAVVEVEEIESPISAQQSQEVQIEQQSMLQVVPACVCDDDDTREIGEPLPIPQDELPRWRSSMYGIDEDDLQFLHKEQPPVIEEEEGRQATDTSNPWTIARMNAATKQNKSIGNGQLPSPAKSRGDIFIGSNSPTTAVTPRQTPPIEPLTPQTSARSNARRSLSDEELERGIRHLPRSSPEQRPTRGCSRVSQEREQFGITPPETRFAAQMPQNLSQRPNMLLSEENQHNFASAGSLYGSPHGYDMPPPISSAPRHRQRKQQSYNNTPFVSPARQPNDTWFGQPMAGAESSQPTRRQKRARNQDVPLFPSDNTFSTRRPIPTEANLSSDAITYPENNSDIRNFFRQNQSQHNGLSQNSQPMPPFSVSSRATSAEPQPRSNLTRKQLLLHSDRGASFEPHDITEQLRAYVEREAPYAKPSLSRATSSEPIQHPNHASNSLNTHESNNMRPEPRNTGTSPFHPPSPHPPSKPAHETPIHQPLKPHPTDPPHRTKSSKLPLERTPNGHRIHDLILPVTTSATCILNASWKLDMRCNTLEWGYSAGHAYDVLAEPVSAGRVGEWVGRIEGLLGGRYERVGEVGVGGVLFEGVGRAVGSAGILDSATVASPTRLLTTKANRAEGIDAPDGPVSSVESVVNANVGAGVDMNAKDKLDDDGDELVFDDDMLMDF
ncbi:hypothetical protein P153DRAFT_333583 [Dothidotthia symphoricarpi CBS 119687]|uniref:DNA mismatch repair protein S5 domain-containing protein n=1 Tax=Dothidotthia symphoricarpi CBS 119687 TaxID=1392245 RepID=A0A6A6ALM3_9PLEO|nr:uncharacterized protein P153DRAFT_333583 [Dothidotthia symphoricarpi CBS 119687]KAF2132892.1 hypothetical protein P153DRAFT_333583 [Dothidotthia symphoricarpi CBS 119687]